MRRARQKPLRTSMKRNPLRPQTGMTLVELVVVVMVIGILVAIVAQKIPGIHRDARTAAAADSVRMMQDAIDVETARTGAIPLDVDPEWFSSHRLPANPFASNPAIIVQVDATGDATMEHPRDKVYLANGSADGAFWYNPANGTIRARVEQRKTNAQTITLYNEVNRSDVTTPDQTISSTAVVFSPSVRLP